MIRDLRLTMVCGFALMVCLAGCRGDGLIDLSGVATYDGQPVKKGSVALMPADGKGPTAAAVIADGKYAVRVAPGVKGVRIEAFKVVGQRPFDARFPGSAMIDILEQTLPERYNTKSQLTREITSGTHTCDFALEK